MIIGLSETARHINKQEQVRELILIRWKLFESTLSPEDIIWPLVGPTQIERSFLR